MNLLFDLALILVVAGAVTLLFKKLKQPLVLGYIVAGFLVSPHMPYTMSVMDTDNVHTWGDIGVTFLLFSLGLDFSFKKIVKMGVAPIIATISIIFCMMLLGICVGYTFGWNKMDYIFLGGMLAMSSTTIIYKAFDDLGIRQQKFAGMVMSVLILEDILAIVMMVLLSAIASEKGGAGGQMIQSIVMIGFVLILWFVVGIFIVPIMLRSMRKLINDETLLVVALGLCCLMAVISVKVGFSSAFGAFVMGSILAETIEAERIIKLVEPVKNLFGAIFFVSVGMLVDPQVLVSYAGPIVALVMTILLGQAIFGSISYFISGQSLKAAMRCGFSMAQIGEFSFIIASMGLALGVISDFLYPVVVAVSVITTFLTPYMIRFSSPCYEFLEKRLPKKWILRLNRLTLSHPAEKQEGSTWKRLLLQMSLNTLIYTILSVAVTAAMMALFLPFAERLMPLWAAHLITGLLTVMIISPFLRAMVMKKNHSEEFKTLWAKNRTNRIPLMLTVLVRLFIATCFIFYVCQKLSSIPGAIIVCIGIVVIALIIFSRRIKHQSIRMERLFIQNLRSREIEAQVQGHRRPLYEGRLLDRDIHISDFDVPMDSAWVGKSLRELELRNKFGIQLSSILRAGRRYNIPDGESIVFPGDRLQVIGSDEQLAAFGHALKNELLTQDEELEKREMKLHRLIISGGSKFLGKTLLESGIRDHYNCMVVGLEEGKENLSQVEPSYRFEKGDILWVVGESDDLNRME